MSTKTPVEALIDACSLSQDLVVTAMRHPHPFFRQAVVTDLLEEYDSSVSAVVRSLDFLTRQDSGLGSEATGRVAFEGVQVEHARQLRNFISAASVTQGILHADSFGHGVSRMVEDNWSVVTRLMSASDHGLPVVSAAAAAPTSGLAEAVATLLSQAKKRRPDPGVELSVPEQFRGLLRPDAVISAMDEMAPALTAKDRKALQQNAEQAGLPLIYAPNAAKLRDLRKRALGTWEARLRGGTLPRGMGASMLLSERTSKISERRSFEVFRIDTSHYTETYTLDFVPRQPYMLRYSLTLHPTMLGKVLGVWIKDARASMTRLSPEAQSDYMLSSIRRTLDSGRATISRMAPGRDVDFSVTTVDGKPLVTCSISRSIEVDMPSDPQARAEYLIDLHAESVTLMGSRAAMDATATEVARKMGWELSSVTTIRDTSSDLYRYGFAVGFILPASDSEEALRQLVEGLRMFCSRFVTNRFQVKDQDREKKVEKFVSEFGISHNSGNRETVTNGARRSLGRRVRTILKSDEYALSNSVKEQLTRLQDLLRRGKIRNLDALQQTLPQRLDSLENFRKTRKASVITEETAVSMWRLSSDTPPSVAEILAYLPTGRIARATQFILDTPLTLAQVARALNDSLLRSASVSALWPNECQARFAVESQGAVEPHNLVGPVRQADGSEFLMRRSVEGIEVTLTLPRSTR